MERIFTICLISRSFFFLIEYKYVYIYIHTLHFKINSYLYLFFKIIIHVELIDLFEIFLLILKV